MSTFDHDDDVRRDEFDELHGIDREWYAVPSADKLDEDLQVYLQAVCGGRTVVVNTYGILLTKDQRAQLHKALRTLAHLMQAAGFE